MTVILVTGGRRYEGRDIVFQELDWLLEMYDEVHIIQGGASGADYFAKEWAKSRKQKCTTEKAQWDKYGKAAGPVRNQKMIDFYSPYMVLAFPGGIGTADMVNRAESAEIIIMKIESE